MRTFILGLILAIFTIAISGCNDVSVCDSRGDKPSVLCEIEAETGVKLKTTGKAIMYANFGAVMSGKTYSARDAEKVFKAIRHVVDGSPSYIHLKRSVIHETGKYPALFYLGDKYLLRMEDRRMLTDFDREILLTWLDDRIAAMGNM